MVACVHRGGGSKGTHCKSAKTIYGVCATLMGVVLKGKLELEMEVVTEEEHNLKPAGKARDEPNLNPKLDPPK